MKFSNSSLLILVAALSFSTSLWARGFTRAPEGQCRASYHSDSAGRGIEAGFKNLNLRPQPVDEGCYDQGVAEGQDLLQNGDQSCSTDFESGKSEGLKASPNSGGSECYTKGYIAGFALLGVSARAGNTSVVGSDCVSEYRQGQSDGQQNNPQAQFPSNFDSACYSTGFYDVGQF